MRPLASSSWTGLYGLSSRNIDQMWGFFLCLFLVALLTPAAECYCWEPGKNPTFTGPPEVRQIDLRTVQLSWEGKVSMIECADQFLVKYWQKNDPQDYVMTPLVPTSQFTISLKVTPKVKYTYQAIAREDKGSIAGIEYNRSPNVDFKTSRINVSPATPVRKQESSPSSGEEQNEHIVTGPGGGGMAGPDPTQEGETLGQELQPKGTSLSVEMIAIIVVCGVVFILIVVGIIYKMTCAKKTEELEDDEDDDDDEDEMLEKEKLDV